jgi:RsiW-degrading membrane proteinase PrsW (M82 family)
MTISTPIGVEVRQRRPALAVFLVGLAIWCVATAITAATRDPILVPTVIVAGSFAVPLAFAVFLFQRQAEEIGNRLPLPVMAAAFLGAGTFGVLLSALLESYLVPPKAGSFIVVGIVEEMCKGVVIILAARKMASRRPLDGMVLGAVVGAGFAAFETAGYAFDAYISSATGTHLVSLVQSQVNRALIGPVGHIIWSSILGGALFAAVGRGRSRWAANLSATFAGVVLLHSFWDQADGWARIITRGVTNGGWHIGWPDAVVWKTTPTHHQLLVFYGLNGGLLFMTAAVGVLWFARCWRRYRRGESGMVADSDVPSPSSLKTCMAPPRASTRSWSPMRPEPFVGSAPPIPSSRMIS